MNNLSRNFWQDFKGIEGRATVTFAFRLFLLMLAYYLLKPVREALILVGGGAELRSYALAAQAGVLLLLVPLYSLLIQRLKFKRLFSFIVLFLTSNLLIFYLVGIAGNNIGVVFFIWLGIFSVFSVAQFWAMVGDFHGVDSGKRLLAYIAFGGSLGAMVGSLVAKEMFNMMGTYGLMLVAIGLLVIVAVIPSGQSPHPDEVESKEETLKKFIGGFKHIIERPFLRWIAFFIIMLNLINSTGEYVLANYVVEEFGKSATRGVDIGEFYSSFYLYVNVLTFVLQLFFVRPMLRYMGVSGILIFLTALDLMMYSSSFLIPTLAWFAVIKITENGVDYSITNTTRQILFLPLDRLTRYESMTTISTFFTRLGDMIQGLLIAVCVGWLGLTKPYLIGIVVGFCMIWVYTASRVAGDFRKLHSDTSSLKLIERIFVKTKLEK